MTGLSIERSAALRDLVELRTPLRAAIARMSDFPLDFESDLVITRPIDVVNALDRYERGDLAEAELVEWAEALFGRDDVGYPADETESVKEALFELSTPELFGPVGETVLRLHARLDP